MLEIANSLWKVFQTLFLSLSLCSSLKWRASSIWVLDAKNLYIELKKKIWWPNVHLLLSSYRLKCDHQYFTASFFAQLSTKYSSCVKFHHFILSWMYNEIHSVSMKILSSGWHFSLKFQFCCCFFICQQTSIATFW